MKTIFDFFSIRRVNLRNIIGFKRLGNWVLRPKHNRKHTGPKHPEQERTNEVFGKARKFGAAFARTMADYPAWATAATLYWAGRTGDNLMFHMNHDKLIGHVVACFHLFRFSFGPRSLPWNLEARADGNTITITWQDNRRSPHCSPHDPLLVGVLFDNKPGKPMLVADSGVTRASCGISIVLNDKQPRKIHLYPFFCNPERTEFSESQHLEVTTDSMSLTIR